MIFIFKIMEIVFHRCEFENSAKSQLTKFAIDGMIKTATSNNVIDSDVTINPPLSTFVTSACGGPRTQEPLFTRFSGEHCLLFFTGSSILGQ
jgi:hypothetical protein